MRLMRRAPSLLLACLLAGCTATGATPRTDIAVAARTALGAADLDTIGEIIRLEDRREFEAVRFQRWVAQVHPEVRSRAVIGMGRIGDRAAALVLHGMLGDSSAEVRKNTAFALGELNDTSVATLEALTDAARQADSVGVEAIAALGRLAHPAGYAVVERLLADKTAPQLLRQEALSAVWRFARRPNTLDLLRPFSAHANAETRWRALYALTRNNADPRAVPLLLKSLQDASGDVRALAARGLRGPTADSAGQRPQARAALLVALRDPHPHVRINAVRALGSFREPANVEPIAKLLRDPDGNTVIAAAEALGQNGGGETYLAELARGVAPIGIRNTALNALLRTTAGPELAFTIARSRVRDAHPLERLFAARVLSDSANPRRLDDARALLGDADGRVVATALGTVAAVDTVNPPRALFVERLAHADAGVRAAALRGLQRRAAPADLELFLNAYELAQRDPQRFASLAAVDALGALRRQGVAVDRAFFLRFGRPQDPLLHERIVQRLGPGAWGPLRPIDTKRPPSFYRELAARFFGADSAAAFPRVRIATQGGSIEVALNAREAPLTVLNFITLAERRYFDGGRWHRVVPNFVLQDGDPRGDGSGGPGTVIRDEINRLRYRRGAVGMALSGPDTGGSQFFITHSPQPHLDGGYTVFGYVIAGMAVADRIVVDDPIYRIEVVR